MARRGATIILAALVALTTTACAVAQQSDDEQPMAGEYFEPELWDDDPATHFEMVEEEFERWDAFVIEGGADEHRDSVYEKLDWLDELIAEYEQVTDHDDVEWTSAAFYRIADMLQRTAQELYVTTVPYEEESDEYWEYHDELDDLAVPLEEEALERYEDLLWWTADQGIENDWVALAYEQVLLFEPIIADEWIEEFPQVTDFIVRHYQQLCDEGYAWECGELAQIYRQGEWVSEDRERTAQLFEDACELEPAECVNLGAMYAAGEGVEQDQSRAAELFEISCEAGDMIGCMEFALRLDEGDGVEQDRELAEEYFDVACVEGIAPACERLEAEQEEIEVEQGEVEEAEASE